MLLGVARVVLGVRNGIRTALLAFAVLGTLLCVTWAGLLLWGTTLPASLAIELAALTAIIGGLAGLLRTEMAGRGLKGDAWAVAVPERHLERFDGLVASADGRVIDACARPLDLAGLIIDSDLAEAHVIDLNH